MSPAAKSALIAEPESGVPLAIRYSAAATELGARIQARQMSFLFYATGSAALIGTILAQGGKPGPVLFITNLATTPALTTKADEPVELMFILYGVLPALFSFAFACWIRHHDVLIGLLSSFLRFCENPDRANRELSWHGPDRGWVEHAFGSRFWLDLGFLSVCLVTVVTSTTFAALHCSWSRSLIAVSSAFVTGLTSWMIRGIHHQRRSIYSAGDLIVNGNGERVFHYQPPVSDIHSKRVALFFLLIIIGVATWLDCGYFEAGTGHDFPDWFPAVPGVCAFLSGYFALPMARGYHLKPLLFAFRWEG